MTHPERGIGSHRTVLVLTLLFVLAVATEALAPGDVRPQASPVAAVGLETGPTKEGRGEQKDRRRRDVDAQIIGGKAVKQGKLRFMTFVEVAVGSGSQLCGGSLIDSLFVLTAAHCVVDLDSNTPFDPSAFSLIIGRADLNNVPAANQRGVTQVTPHPDFDPMTLANDVAVLRLDEAVPGSIARPMRLAKANQSKVDRVKNKAVVAGWGVTDSGATSDRLQEATLRLVSSSSCSAAYGADYQAAIMLCAAAPGRDSCQGDSGGPLIVKDKVGSKRKKRKKGQRHRRRVPIMRNFQTGIVSSGFGCAIPGFPGVYTRLTAPGINDFIVEVVNGQ